MKKSLAIQLIALVTILSACSRPIPDGEAEKKYVKDGIIETYYEKLTTENESELRGTAGDEFKTHGWKWRQWSKWRFVGGKEKFESKDELWYFSTDPESWKNMAGRMGFRVLRDEEVVAEIITLMN